MPTDQSSSLSNNSSAGLNRNKWRMLKDKLAAYGVTVGGMSVIVAITLIFFYLLMVVLPLFESASIEKQQEYTVAQFAESKPLYYVIDEQGEIGIRISEAGNIVTFKVKTGELISENSLVDQKVTSFAISEKSSGILALGLDNGTALVVKLGFKTAYDENTNRIITAEVTYPLGEEPIELDSEGLELKQLAIQANEESISLVSINTANFLQLSNFILEESMLHLK